MSNFYFLAKKIEFVIINMDKTSGRIAQLVRALL
jgi:hypothetical protein